MKKISASTAQPKKLLLRSEAIATLEQRELLLVHGALQVAGSGPTCKTQETDCRQN